MKKVDQLHSQLAARLAWRADVSDEELRDLLGPPAAPPAPPPPPASGEASQKELLALREHAREGCAKLADEIARAWAIPLMPVQAVAVRRLARKADALSIELGALDELWAVRLARLFVRHYGAMTKANQSAARSALLWVNVGHPEVSDLIIEVAERGNRALSGVLLVNDGGLEGDDDDTGEELVSLPISDTVGSRLARVVDEGPDDARAVALRWLERYPSRDAMPALRRALRRDDAEIRALALLALTSVTPLAIAPEDVVFLLEESCEMRGPSFRVIDDLDSFESEDLRLGFADALHTAIAELRPSGAEDLLVDLVDRVDYFRFDDPLDREWALHALAAAFPERAAELIDDALYTAHVRARAMAVEALELMPEAEARPRLVRAARDGAPQVGERARAIWLARFAEACPARAEPEGIDLDDERTAARVLVLSNGSVGARDALARALLREAPEPAALALLVFALEDDELGERTRRPGLPRSRKAWARTLVARFGVPAIAALSSLAERLPRAVDGRPGWFEVLRELVKKGVIKKQNASALRDAAARVISSEAWDGDTDVLHVLLALGAPAFALDQLVEIAVRDDDAAAYVARDVLKAWRGDAPVDARLLEQVERALARRELDRFEHALEVAAARRVRAALDLGMRAVDDADRLVGAGGELALEALAGCAQVLHRARRLPDRWLLEALRVPESPRFVIAARACSGAKKPDIERALRATLRSPARAGASAAEAAAALMYLKARLTRADVEHVLSHAPERARVDLLLMLFMRRAFLPVVTRHLRALLGATDPEVAEAIADLLPLLHARSMRRLLKTELPRVADPWLRQAIEEHLDRAF